MKSHCHRRRHRRRRRFALLLWLLLRERRYNLSCYRGPSPRSSPTTTYQLPAIRS
ncbi:MAG: hypothetical protein K6U87_05080 [Firmicutes bacterium]|nr:hypothetical protein [Bacillota bacterium]